MAPFTLGGADRPHRLVRWGGNHQSCFWRTRAEDPLYYRKPHWNAASGFSRHAGPAVVLARWVDKALARVAQPDALLEAIQLGGIVDQDSSTLHIIWRPVGQEIEQQSIVRLGVTLSRVRPIRAP